MSTKDYITKLLDMEDVVLKNIQEEAQEITIELELQQKEHLCPECGALTSRVHDYHYRMIRDLDLRGKRTTLHYRQRRYICPECKKRFTEECSFAGRYQRTSYRVTGKTIDLLRRRSSLKAVAEDTGTSLSAVNRVLNTLAVPRPEVLPEAVSFDEFKGNLGGERFQCIVTDPLNHRVLDILPKRTVESIQDYLRSFPNRDEVKYVVMDMNRGFRDVARTFFPNARIIIDRFHVVRFCTEAMENVRRNVQTFDKLHEMVDKLPADQRRYFKRSRRLLLKHRDQLTREDRAAVDVMLRFSDRLMQAYALKEAFYDFMAAPDRTEAGRRLDFWLDACDRLRLPEFMDCRRMLRNWRDFILNAFEIRLSNGFTEGCNNAIKMLKRASFGCQNFSRFRKRVLLSFSLHPNI